MDWRLECSVTVICRQIEMIRRLFFTATSKAKSKVGIDLTDALENLCHPEYRSHKLDIAVVGIKSPAAVRNSQHGFVVASARSIFYNFASFENGAIHTAICHPLWHLASVVFQFSGVGLWSRVPRFGMTSYSVNSGY